MSDYIIQDTTLQNIANAIRSVTNTSNTYYPNEMAAAIQTIEGGYPEPTGTISITQNGTANVKDFAAAAVNVQPNLQSKTATQNGTVTPDSGYDGLSSVTVNVPGGGGAYELLEYIESNGTQGINTGSPVPANANLRASFLVGSGTNNYSWAFGGEYSGSEKFSGVQIATSRNSTVMHDGTGNYTSRSGIRYIGNAMVDATAQVTTNAASISNLWVFAIGRNDASGYSSMSKLRLYHFAVNDSIYLPCRRKSDGVCGLWDSANQRMLTDALNGDLFVAGPVIGTLDAVEQSNE